MSSFDRLVSVINAPLMPDIAKRLIRECKVFEFGTHIGEKETHPTLKAENAAFRSTLPFPKTAILLGDLTFILQREHDTMTAVFFYTAQNLKSSNMLACSTIKINTISPDEIGITVLSEEWYGEKNLLLRKLGAVPGPTELEHAQRKLEEKQESILHDSLLVALEVLLEINTIDRFILETSPLKVSSKVKKGAVPKLADRPLYTILTPKEIRKKFGTYEEGVRTTGAHERRGHIRTYPDNKERYPKAHGKSIWIDAIWVGESEAIVGNKKYRVVLENTHA